jgi:hypothetical protein
MTANIATSWTTSGMASNNNKDEQGRISMTRKLQRIKRRLLLQYASSTNEDPALHERPVNSYDSIASTREIRLEARQLGLQDTKSVQMPPPKSSRSEEARRRVELMVNNPRQSIVLRERQLQSKLGLLPDVSSDAESHSLEEKKKSMSVAKISGSRSTAALLPYNKKEVTARLA